MPLQLNCPFIDLVGQSVRIDRITSYVEDLVKASMSIVMVTTIQADLVTLRRKVDELQVTDISML